jgi:hypothetical protein
MITLLLFFSWFTMNDSNSQSNVRSDTFYRGELIGYPGPWAFQLGQSSIILVNDQDLEDLTDPDRKIDLSTSYTRHVESLRDICERAQKRGQQTLIIAFDHFFSQYRPGQHTPRRLTPDMDEYIEKMAKISDFTKQYGLGLELSLLSPLEIGPAYAKRTGETGKWMQYRKGLRDPETGTYSVQLWQQKKWANNKGAIHIQDAGVRVFAFSERRIRNSPYIFVDPNAIVEITATAKVERWETMAVDRGDYRAERIRVYGKGMTDIGSLDRVLVIQQYHTPEMDYFSVNALPFLKTLVDKYVDAGIKLNALYSDEMHIQQDWGYFNHHDNGEFAIRYVSDGFAQAFAREYGEEHRDFAKYLLYFTQGQEDYRNDMQAKQPLQHVFGDTPEAIRRTALFRSRYYRLLQDGVVDLFSQAKKYAESRYGYLLHSRAHATWAESPTIDLWDGGQGHRYAMNYEYTSDFVWSNTVHQAASACHDYFKWGEFLTGTGNDHCECGWLDRNYVGIALACSTGIINEIPYSYAAHWGMPHELGRRRMALVNAAGASASPFFAMVQDSQHRDVDVLTLYPIDLVSVDERFGSWMTQYAYANYITQSKLLEMATVKNGKIELAGRQFTTLTIAFEPFPSHPLLQMICDFTQSGGKVIWSGPPPMLSREGDSVLNAWMDLFGVDYDPGFNEGQIAVGKQVEFHGEFSHIEPQIILTHFLFDHIYPVKPRPFVQTIASVRELTVGTRKPMESGGCAVFFGFRPRDDQAKSLGYDVRTWFEILNTLGAYPASDKFENINDNTEYISRTSGYFACRFPNGAVAIAPHLRETVENWDGGFARNEERDRNYLENNPPPSDALHLVEMKINGHEITYEGSQVVAFRMTDKGELLAFAGHDCRGILIDGKHFEFSDHSFPLIAFAPVPQERRVENGAIYLLRIDGEGEIRLPLSSLPQSLECIVEGAQPGSRGITVPHTYQDGMLTLTASLASNGRWIYVVEK